jgi:curved DNA-binding protein CbpA
LKKAYKKAAIKNHPDKGGDPEKVPIFPFLRLVFSVDFDSVEGFPDLGFCGC